MASSNHLFDLIRSINTKEPMTMNPKEANAFVLSLFLSHHSETIEYVDKILPFIYSIPDKVIYKYYFKAIPKNPRRYIKYTKKSVGDKEDVHIKELCDKYGISPREALISIGAKK